MRSCCFRKWLGARLVMRSAGFCAEQPLVTHAHVCGSLIRRPLLRSAHKPVSLLLQPGFWCPAGRGKRLQHKPMGLQCWHIVCTAVLLIIGCLVPLMLGNIHILLSA